MTTGRVRKEGSMGDTVVDVSVFYVNTRTARRVKVVLERNIDPNVTRSVDSVELRDVARLRTDVVIDRVWHLDYLYAHNYAYIELHTVRCGPPLVRSAHPLCIPPGLPLSLQVPPLDGSQVLRFGPLVYLSYKRRC